MAANDKKAPVAPIVKRVNAQRRQEFTGVGAAPRWVYDIHITTMNDNSGTFTVPATLYEDDTKLGEYLQEAVFNLDKAAMMLGAVEG